MAENTEYFYAVLRTSLPYLRISNIISTITIQDNDGQCKYTTTEHYNLTCAVVSVSVPAFSNVNETDEAIQICATFTIGEASSADFTITLSTSDGTGIARQ